MWYVRVFLLILFIVVVLSFGLLNSGAQVTLRLWNPGAEGVTVNAVIALFAAFVLGGLVFFFISLYREIRLRREHKRLKRDLIKARRELDTLRMAPLDGPLARSPAHSAVPGRARREGGEQA